MAVSCHLLSMCFVIPTLICCASPLFSQSISSERSCCALLRQPSMSCRILMWRPLSCLHENVRACRYHNCHCDNCCYRLLRHGELPSSMLEDFHQSRHGMLFNGPHVLSIIKTIVGTGHSGGCLSPACSSGQLLDPAFQYPAQCIICLRSTKMRPCTSILGTHVAWPCVFMLWCR